MKPVIKSPEINDLINDLERVKIRLEHLEEMVENLEKQLNFPPENNARSEESD